MREIEEKGFMFIFLDELNSLFCVAAGESGLVGRFFEGFFVAHKGAWFHIVAVWDAVIVVKAVISWQEAREMSKVPLANAAGCVAGGL